MSMKVPVMLALRFALCMLVLFALVPALGETLRIDGSSDDAADKSFATMVKAASADQKQQLLTALVMINVDGTQGAREVHAKGATFYPSASHVREKINGMTAEQIIALGAEAQARTPGLNVVMRQQSPGDQGHLRIDGTSDKAANDSFGALVNAAPVEQRNRLLNALIQLNMRGVQSARDAMFDPSAARVRAEINGMTAEEIIAAADRAKASGETTVTIRDPNAVDPGVPADLLRPLTGGDSQRALGGTTWEFEQRANGTVQKYVYRLNPDGTATMIETDLKPNGVTRWEAAGNEFLLSINDGYAVMRGTFDSDGSMHGDGGNREAFRYTWTGTKR